MGCGSSKRIEAAAEAADVYRPSPASFAVFDINSVQEPWLLDQPEKLIAAPHVPEVEPPERVLETVDVVFSDDAAPKPWAEVSKALVEELKPTLLNGPVLLTLPPNPKRAPLPPPSPARHSPQNPIPSSPSIHTLEELDGKLPPPPSKSMKFIDSVGRKKDSEKGESRRVSDPEGLIRPVRENPFVVRDRSRKEEDGGGKPRRWDPLSEFPEKCPPGEGGDVVIYTTSLRGVRRTYEDCERVRAVLELHGVAFDERDVALHAGFRDELRAILGGEGEGGVPPLPRIFLRGRYLGGAEEVVGMNESGRLGRLLRWAGVERGRQAACEGCGGRRFVPCLDCGGSCFKVAAVVNGTGGEKERCSKCNENGLVRCPGCCHSPAGAGI